MKSLERLIPFDWEALAHKYPRTWDFIKKYWKDGLWIVLIAALLVGTGYCVGGRKSRKTINAPPPSSGLVVQSPAFGGRGGDRIPARYTADGQDYSPPLEFLNLPAGTVELALIVEDPDAGAEPFVHWVVYGISPDSGGLFEAVPPPPEDTAKEEPAKRTPGRQPIKPAPTPEPAARWAKQGRNSFGTLGYRGPAPPPGSGVHHYHFRLFALNAALGAEDGLTKPELEALMEGKVIEQTKLVGTYRR